MGAMFDRQHLFFGDTCALYAEGLRLGFKMSPGEIYRTAYQQAEYLRTGFSKAPHSKHEDKLAVDIAFEYKGQYLGNLPAEEQLKILEPLGRFWEKLRPGNRWGGNFDRDWTKKDNFRDIPHFEAA